MTCTHRTNREDPLHRPAPLHVAVAGGHIEAVKLLLKHGASLDARSLEGHTPIALAQSLGHAAVAKILLSAEARQAKEEL